MTTATTAHPGLHDALAPYTLAADLLEVRRIYRAFFEGLSDQDWQRPTDRRARAWTLRETVAHLDAVLAAYGLMVDAALAGAPARLPGATRREDLSAWNRQEIDARAGLPAPALCGTLLDGLQTLARRAAALSPEEAERRVQTPLFNAPMSAAELIGAQVVHMGLVHAAQVANGARHAPLWRTLGPGARERMLSRFFCLAGFLYWQERGGDLRATIAFEVGGPGGGSWHVAVGPDGGRAHIGPSERADLTFGFRDTEAAFQSFTFQNNLLRDLLGGRARLRGSLRLAARFPELFMPT
jgi:hypothetical protein